MRRCKAFRAASVGSDFKDLECVCVNTEIVGQQ
jgi:hypothetical protein